MSIYINLHEFMRSYEAKITENRNNLFKQQFLMRLDDVLCIIIIV
jgi:hypothetical protein